MELSDDHIFYEDDPEDREQLAEVLATNLEFLTLLQQGNSIEDALALVLHESSQSILAQNN